ncbi:hypothetical protein DIPPA_03762 [Diplonema papillatum]|nr:hypothetical protein DIPPA_03762 [Diplonema papillatum]
MRRRRKRHRQGRRRSNRPPVRTALPTIDAAARCQKIAEDDLRTPIELPHDAADFELDELRSDVAQQRAELAAQAEARAPSLGRLPHGGPVKGWCGQ